MYFLSCYPFSKIKKTFKAKLCEVHMESAVAHSVFLAEKVALMPLLLLDEIGFKRVVAFVPLC